MRNWLFHPLIFYPLALLVAAAVILFSLQPQSLPRDPAPVAGEISGATLVLEGAAFDTPTGAPEQVLTVDRDFWGRPQSLRIAVLPGSNREPRETEAGVLIQLDPASAALLEAKRLAIEITYLPLPVNSASALAVRFHGTGASRWITRAIPPQSGVVTFNMPPARGVTGIGLRAITRNEDQAYGVEITRIRIAPRPGRQADD